MLETLLIVVLVLMVVNLGLVISSRRGAHAELIALIEKSQDHTERLIREEFARSRDQAAGAARLARDEMAARFAEFGQTVSSRMADSAAAQKSQLDLFAANLAYLTQSNEKRLGDMRQTVETGLEKLRQDNSQKLEQMRATVDEKLHATLEQRLGESFRLVSDRLELVHKGLGEMQSLASGVGDLKRVLTNIKTRGGWGEIQLGNLLDQVLTPDQYAANVSPSPTSSERVDFAIRLPGREAGDRGQVWLPIDAKFPQEDYQRLLEAQENGTSAQVEEAARALELRIRLEARKIHDKYINPPHTTDFAIMFLPTEGLFAEALRRPGLLEALQRDCRVSLMGPTTLGAILNSLQMGFRTLAIERRSSEVWSVLGAVKTEFAKFGGVLDKVQKKLQEASSTVEQAATRSRVLERHLRKVQDLPSGDPPAVLPESSDPAALNELEELEVKPSVS